MYLGIDPRSTSSTLQKKKIRIRTGCPHQLWTELGATLYHIMQCILHSECMPYMLPLHSLIRVYMNPWSVVTTVPPRGKFPYRARIERVIVYRSLLYHGVMGTTKVATIILFFEFVGFVQNCCFFSLPATVCHLWLKHSFTHSSIEPFTACTF